MTTLARRALSQLPSTHSGRTLSYLHLADAVGKGVFLSGSVVYFTQVTGLTAGTIGLGASLAGVGGLLATLVLGPVADRRGPRLVLFLMLAVQTLGFALYPAVHSVATFLVVITVMGVAEHGGGPAFGGIIAALHSPEQRVKVRAWLRTVFNTGFALGTGVSALTMLAGEAWVRALPVIAAVMMGVSAVLALRLPRVAPVPRGRTPLFSAVRNLRFMSVVALNFPLALHATVLLVALPLLIVTSTDLPDAVVPATLIVNTVLVILLQVRASKGAEDLSGAARVGREAGLWLAAGCVLIMPIALLPDAAALAVVVVVVLLLTVAELRQASASWGMAHALAPREASAEYIGTFNLYSVAQSIVGPVLLVATITSLGDVAWAIAALLAAAAGLALPVAVRAAALPQHDRQGVAR